MLTDGFPVSGFGVPALAVPKGDLAAACVAAASVLAKVTRDRLMADSTSAVRTRDLHKGYCTPTHSAALAEHGPCTTTGSASSTSPPAARGPRARA